MGCFAENIRPWVDAEIEASRKAEQAGDTGVAFMHLERAHVLGQASTVLHVRVHWLMFCWGWRQGSLRECTGQLLRMIGAATKTAIGLVPHGNTGGSNVSPFRRMPVSPELENIIRRANE